MTLSIPERRAAVARRISNGESNRKIAAALGISKDTVRRDLAALNGPITVTTAPAAAPPASERRPARTTRLRRRTRRTTTRTPARATPPDPTHAPATITVTVDEWVRRALIWCARAGHPDPVDAIRWALGEQAARIHAQRTATDHTPMGD